MTRFHGRRAIVTGAASGIGSAVAKRLVEEGGKVALAIMDPANPYRYMQIRGKVTKVTKDGADAHIDKLAHKYLGTDYPFRQPGEDRILVEIEPESVQVMG